MTSNSVGIAVASILGRTPLGVTRRTLSWEEIVDEGRMPMNAIDTADWSDDPVSNPASRHWQSVGWLVDDVTTDREIVTFRRNTHSAGFVGTGGIVP